MRALLTRGRFSVSRWITLTLSTGQGAETDEKSASWDHPRLFLCIKSVTRVRSCASNWRSAPEPLYRLKAGEVSKTTPRPFLRMVGYEARRILCIVWRDLRRILCIVWRDLRRILCIVWRDPRRILCIVWRDLCLVFRIDCQ